MNRFCQFDIWIRIVCVNNYQTWSVTFKTKFNGFEKACRIGLLCFYDIANIVGYLMPNNLYIYIYWI